MAPRIMKRVPAYSPAPGYFPNEASEGEKPPVAMVATPFTTASSGSIPISR